MKKATYTVTLIHHDEETTPSAEEIQHMLEEPLLDAIAYATFKTEEGDTLSVGKDVHSIKDFQRGVEEDLVTDWLDRAKALL